MQCEHYPLISSLWDRTLTATYFHINIYRPVWMHLYSHNTHSCKLYNNDECLCELPAEGLQYVMLRKVDKLRLRYA